jgi:hypothetical protein
MRTLASSRVLLQHLALFVCELDRCSLSSTIRHILPPQAMSRRGKTHTKRSIYLITILWNRTLAVLTICEHASGTELPANTAEPKTRHQTEPPKWPTETNGGISLNRRSNGQSLVRDRRSLTAKTPRNRGIFWGDRQVLARVRYSQSLGGAVGGVVGALVSAAATRQPRPNRTPSWCGETGGHLSLQPLPGNPKRTGLSSDGP